MIEKTDDCLKHVISKIFFYQIRTYNELFPMLINDDQKVQVRQDILEHS